MDQGPLVDDQEVIDVVLRSVPAVIIRYEDIDADRGVLENLTPRGLANIDEKPVFAPASMGRTFFARSPEWVVWREKNGFFGETDHIPNMDRAYTLRDVQRIAFALHDRKKINLDRLVSTLRIVREIARLYKYLP